MALSNGVRSCASKLVASTKCFVPKSANRAFHSSGMKRMTGGNAHAHDEPYYLHAKHMYNLDRMSYRTLKVTLGVITVLGLGSGIPIYACVFTQRKTASA